MGLFKKKADPISQRAKALNAEIAALEAKIQKLNSQPAKTANEPRVRSTAFPGRIAAAPPPPPATREPIFEDVDQNRLQASEPVTPPQQYNQLGVRKYDLLGFLGRMKGNFRSRPAANPKLVNYLAAGSIQGLRPLRYEKRVARNRFVVVTIVLVLAAWGVIAMFIRHH